MTIRELKDAIRDLDDDTEVRVTNAGYIQREVSWAGIENDYFHPDEDSVFTIESML